MENKCTIKSRYLIESAAMECLGQQQVTLTNVSGTDADLDRRMVQCGDVDGKRACRRSLRRAERTSGVAMPRRDVVSLVPEVSVDDVEPMEFLVDQSGE